MIASLRWCILIGVILVSAVLTGKLIAASKSYDTQVGAREPNPLADAMGGLTCRGGPSTVIGELRSAEWFLTKCWNAYNGEPCRDQPIPDEARPHVQAARALLAPYLGAESTLRDYDAALASILPDIPTDGVRMRDDSPIVASLRTRVKALEGKPIEVCESLYRQRDAEGLAALQTAESTHIRLIWGNFLWYWMLGMGILILRGRKRRKAGQ